VAEVLTAKQSLEVEVHGGFIPSGHLLTRGRIMPFVTVGGGLAHSTGTDTVLLVGHSEFLSCGGVCPGSELCRPRRPAPQSPLLSW